MIYKTNILALIGGGEIPFADKKKLLLWDDKEEKIIAEFKFAFEILNVKLKMDRQITNQGYLLFVRRKSTYF